MFDFYNDEWDTEDEEIGERSGLLRGWGADELDRLLAGNGTVGANTEDIGGRQPKRKTGMSYGATASGGRRRRQSALLASQGNDPTILPGSSMFGFLERLPWRIGGRGVRYKPSAADLQENLLGGERQGHGNVERRKPGMDIEVGSEEETSALLDDDDDDEEEADGNHQHKQHINTHQSLRRNRAGTTSSRSTQNSLSSRGDLFPSEDEAADAVPLDDSFALSFARRSSDSGEHDTENELDPPTARSKSSSSNKSAPSSRYRTGKKKSHPTSHLGQKITSEATQSHNSHSPAHSEMVHSPLTPTPLTPSRSGPGSGEGVRSAWSIHSDAENEADESALVSPVVERVEVDPTREVIKGVVEGKDSVIDDPQGKELDDGNGASTSRS